MQTGPTHEALKPLCWLLGKWTSICAEAKYPTMEKVKFCAELNYKSFGPPMFTHTFKSWCGETGTPLHMERGFLAIKPGGRQVALVLAHHMNEMAHTSIEEGCVNGEQITFESKKVHTAKMSIGPVLCELKRCIRLNDKGELESLVCMATDKTTFTEHYRIVYEKTC